jgi:hypothetical protein
MGVYAGDYWMGVYAGDYTSAIWRKSRRSADSGDCVEIASSRTSVLLRDSHDRCGAVLVVTPTEWRRLLERIRNPH